MGNAPLAPAPQSLSLLEGNPSPELKEEFKCTTGDWCYHQNTLTSPLANRSEPAVNVLLVRQGGS